MAEAALARTPAARAPTVLEVKGLQAWYNESHILHGVDLDVREGEVVTLLGRNGAGKTTTLKSIMGIVRKRIGSVAFDGKELIDLSIDQIARLGVALCPEERAIFASLSVKENLFLPPQIGKTGVMSVERIFSLFPNLRERLASGGGKLSGGEQQMLAIARILRTGARFLMLDEPTEGLAPVIIQQIGRTIAELKREGFTILLVEQNFRFASTLADRFFVMEHGRIIDAFANSELAGKMEMLHETSGGVMTTAASPLTPALSRKRERRRGRTRGAPAVNVFGHAISMPQLFGQLLDRPHQRLFLCAVESRPRRHFRHAHHRQFRPRRVLHDGGFRRLFSAAMGGPQLLVGADPLAAGGRRDRRDRRAAVLAAPRRLRSALQPAPDLRPGAYHSGAVPELFRRFGSALRDPQAAQRRLQSRLHVSARLSRLGDRRLGGRLPRHLARDREDQARRLFARGDRESDAWCAPSASTCRAWSR